MPGKLEAAKNIISKVGNHITGKAAAQSGRGLINWAMAHPKATGAVIGGAAGGGLAAVTGHNVIGGIAGGAVVGGSIGGIVQHRANVKLGDVQAEYGAKLDGVSADDAKSIRAEYNEKRKDVVDKSRILSAQESRETRRKNIARMRGQESIAGKEARASEVAASQPKQYRQVDRTSLKKGVIGGGKNAQTSGKFKMQGQNWTLGYDADKPASSAFFATSSDGQRLGMNKEQWFEHVKEAKGALNGAADDAIEAALFETQQIAEEISQTAALDGSGIMGWISEHPLGAVGIAAGGAFVASRIFDDD